MAVLPPVKIVIDNYPEGQTEEVDAVKQSRRTKVAGKAQVPFSKVLYIEAGRFPRRPAQAYYRLSPGRGSALALRLFHYREECW